MTTEMIFKVRSTGQSFQVEPTLDDVPIGLEFSHNGDRWVSRAVELAPGRYLLNFGLVGDIGAEIEIDGVDTATDETIVKIGPVQVDAGTSTEGTVGFRLEA